MICARGLRLERKGRRILSDVDFRARPGEVTAILGANGAGKSTLLRVLAGELKPGSGTVKFGGRALDEWDALEFARRRAVVTQSSALSFSFAVIDVVLQGRAPRWTGRETSRDARSAIHALAKVGLVGFADRDYLTLSGGERQRVHVARALAQLDGETEGCALLLDEPTASLDLKHQHAVLGEVRNFARAGGCAVVVLHDLHLCATYATRVCLMARGRVLASGDAGAVLEGAWLSAAYGIRVERVGAESTHFRVIPEIDQISDCK